MPTIQIKRKSATSNATETLKDGELLYDKGTGKLKIGKAGENGGVDSTVIDAGNADQLKTSRNLKVDLESNSEKSFDGSGNVTDIGVGGTLKIGNGGTGATNVNDAVKSLINGLDDISSISNDTTIASTIDNSTAPSAKKITFSKILSWIANGLGITTGTSKTFSGKANTAGTADTATKLATARTIGGVSFDGTTNINLPGVNMTGNKDTTGNAGSADKLNATGTIGNVSVSSIFTYNGSQMTSKVAAAENADKLNNKTLNFSLSGDTLTISYL